jgi:hypothetical protein
LPPSPRSSLALALVVAGAVGCNRPPRRPIERKDAGPAVVMVERRNEPRATGPTTPEIEPNDVGKSAQPIEPGARIAGAITPATPIDVDCFGLRPLPSALDLGAPRDLGPTDAGTPPVAIAFVTVTPAEEGGQLVIDLLDDKGRVVLSRGAAAGQHATLHYLRLDPATGATVRVRLPTRKKAAPPPSAAVGYTLEYAARWLTGDEEPLPEVEPDDQLAQAVALPPRGTLTGRLDGTDDRDLVSLPALPEGATYRVELAAIAELALEVQVRAGKEVLSSARGGKGGELRLRNAPGRATLPLVLQLRAIDGASDTPYTLRVASESPVEGVEHEPNDRRPVANPAAPGQSIAGYLWPGDADWFCGPAGTALGARVDGLADVDWKLEAAADDGAVLAKADAGKKGAGESLEPVPNASCIKISARARDTAFDAPYHLTFLP